MRSRISALYGTSRGISRSERLRSAVIAIAALLPVAIGCSQVEHEKDEADGGKDSGSESDDSDSASENDDEFVPVFTRSWDA